jgi:hypothetical protein
MADLQREEMFRGGGVFIREELAVDAPREPSPTLSAASNETTDDVLQRVGQLTHLETLTIDSAQITDAGLAHLIGLRKLGTLYIRNCPKLSSAGLVHLMKLPKLSLLSLTGIRIDGQGLEAIGGMRNLKSLYLSEGSINSSGLEPLTQLKQLQLLSLENIRLASPDVSALLKCEALAVFVSNQEIYRGREAIAEFVRGK